MNKKILILAIPAILVLGGVLAYYYFSVFNFQFDISEPFAVYYDYFDGMNPQSDCGLMEDWTEITTGTLTLPERYPGDEVRICFAIVSTADSDITIATDLSGDWDTKLESYDNGIPTTILGDTNTKGYIDYVVDPAATGTFTGAISFRRV